MKIIVIIWVLPFLNNPKYLDLSFKTDLDIWIVLEGKKTLSYSQKNTVHKLLEKMHIMKLHIITLDMQGCSLWPILWLLW